MLQIKFDWIRVPEKKALSTQSVADLTEADNCVTHTVLLDGGAREAARRVMDSAPARQFCSVEVGAGFSAISAERCTRVVHKCTVGIHPAQGRCLVSFPTSLAKAWF